MNIVAFAASSSKKSINKQLVTHAASVLENLLNKNVAIDVLDLNDFEMPIYSIDRENDGGIPDAAKQFFEKIGNADRLLISFAEHNGSYTAAYKNIFDWASRIDSKVYQGKPCVWLSTSPGKGGAKSVLSSAVDSAPHFNADLRGSLSVPSFFDNFDNDSQSLKDDDLANALHSELKKMV